MDKLFLFIPKKTRILVVFLVISIVALTLILLNRRPPAVTPTPLPVISQSPIKTSPLQKTIIGKSTTDEIERGYQIQSKQVLANGDLKYSIDSDFKNRQNQIIFHNNLVKFEKIIIAGQSTSPEIKISDQILKYGPAEKVIKGSKFYGYHMDTYIYANKGLAFIANTKTDEIYEIQVFAPTSLENYLSNYGDDIQENKGITEGI